MIVRRRTRVFRTSFKKLADGAVYYELMGNTGPLVKAGLRSRLPMDSPPSTPGWVVEAVSDTSIAVERVPGFLLGHGW